MLFPSVRNLPDVTAENFSKVDLRQFKWVHWEVSGFAAGVGGGQVFVAHLSGCNWDVVGSAGPKRRRTGEDDPAGGGVQRLCAATTENNCFGGDRENQRAALPAVSAR